MNPKKDFFAQLIAVGGGDRGAADQMYKDFSAFVDKTVSGGADDDDAEVETAPENPESGTTQT